LKKKIRTKENDVNEVIEQKIGQINGFPNSVEYIWGMAKETLPTNYLTNFMAYGTRRFNAAFTRALQ